ncbi:MAG: carboxymuconolactone decarboxylase family protein [Candidatus Lokiarchaeota archaeon]|nr:carboxymuconolactone decarboxylase family protein [Candidatus Lokiarchaeota archaeon]
MDPRRSNPSPDPRARKPRFQKRSYTFGSLARDVAIALKAAPAILDEMRGKGQGLEPRFKEHVMLAVTAVNKCRYCSWVHSRLALQSGCSSLEVKAILASDFADLDDGELVALAFAQHYAETGGKPEPGAARKLLLAYGKEKASAIVASIQAMMIGNLTGNTLDAFNARLRGERVEGGSPLLEFIVFLIGKPATRLLGIG